MTVDNVEWSGAPDRDEAGSPNVVGAVALAAAIKALNQIGLDVIAKHEAELTAYALEQLKPIELRWKFTARPMSPRCTGGWA